MIEWLNQNQGAAIVIVTSVYVLATLVIMFVSWRTFRRLKEANDLTRSSLDQAWSIEKERSRPYVIFDFVVKGRYFYASLKNYGQRPAFDVTSKVNPPLPCDSEISGIETDAELSFVTDKVPLLAPGREILDLVTTNPDFIKVRNVITIQVTLSYLDSEGRRYEEVTDFPMGHYMHHWLLHCLDSPGKNE